MNILINEKADYSKIHWLKEVGEPDKWAYMDHNEGEHFILRWPKNSPKYPAKAAIGEIILIKQQQKLTHLVMPCSNKILVSDDIPRWPFGREVICVKRLDKYEAPYAKDVIPFSTSGGSHGNGYLLQSFINSHQGIVTLEELQKKIWMAFFPSLQSIEVLKEKSTQDISPEEFPEGRIAFSFHKHRERNQDLIKKAKFEGLKKYGCLKCEICEFIFKDVYGDLGKDFIEAHHKIPVSELEPESKTKVEDLSLVCSNCHSMLHRSGNIPIEELKQKIVV